MKALTRSLILIAGLLGTLPASAASPASSLEIIRLAAEHGEGLWKQIASSDPRPDTSSRGIIGYALALCEARLHPERLHRLFALVRSTQDVDPKSKNCGNLKWYWRDPGVTDPNAIEFCMQDALTISARHNDWLPVDARDELNAFIQQGIQGCLQHRVPTDYTNIAILNAGNLIVAGERFNQPDAAVEGRLRLDGILLYTAAFGIHEYDSPTYYGTDLSGLLMLHTLGHEPRERDQAEAMLKLFWTDIAVNWNCDNQRLGGCHSRSYDYLGGIGALDWQLWAQGWLRSDKEHGIKPESAERREPWGDEWTVPKEISDRHLFVPPRNRKPGFVEQRWGALPAEVRWNWTGRPGSLSCAGACYGAQDCPLTIDLPIAGRKTSRCYFIADGREDPYGKKKFATGSAKHMKALHLQPFWAGAQQSNNAVGLVLYRPGDLKDSQVNHLQSHFVLRRPSEGIWRDNERCSLVRPAAGKPANHLALKEGQSLRLNYGTMSVTLRVPWTYHASGMPAPTIALIDDGNDFDCLRLTVDHGQLDREKHELSKDVNNAPLAGAAFYVCLKTVLDIGDDDKKVRFDYDIEANPVVPKLRCLPRDILPVADLPANLIASDAVHSNQQETAFVPPDFILRVNGQEIGRPLLEAVEPLRSMKLSVGFWKPIEVHAAGSTSWPARAGLVLPGMTVQPVDGIASCVLQEPSASGQPPGSVFWKLHVEKAGTYSLFAHVRSKGSNHGSFMLTASDQHGPIVPPVTWDLHSEGKWAWKALNDSAGHPQAIKLPTGDVLLQLRTKASGTAIECLKLTATADLQE